MRCVDVDRPPRGHVRGRRLRSVGGAAPTVGETMSGDELSIRQATDDDLPQILELLRSSLGWVPDDQ